MKPLSFIIRGKAHSIKLVMPVSSKDCDCNIDRQRIMAILNLLDIMCVSLHEKLYNICQLFYVIEPYIVAIESAKRDVPELNLIEFALSEEDITILKILRQKDNISVSQKEFLDSIVLKYEQSMVRDVVKYCKIPLNQNFIQKSRFLLNSDEFNNMSYDRPIQEYFTRFVSISSSQIFDSIIFQLKNSKIYLSNPKFFKDGTDAKIGILSKIDMNNFISNNFPEYSRTTVNFKSFYKALYNQFHGVQVDAITCFTLIDPYIVDLSSYMWEYYANKTGIAFRYSLLELLDFYCDYSKSKFENHKEILMPLNMQYILQEKLDNYKKNTNYDFLVKYINFSRQYSANLDDYNGLKKHQADLNNLHRHFISLKSQEKWEQEQEFRIHYPLGNDPNLLKITDRTRATLGLSGIDKMDPYAFAKKRGISIKKLINLQCEESRISLETFFHEKHNIKPFITPYEIIMGYNISPEAKSKIIDEFCNTKVKVSQISKEIDRNGYYKKICHKN